MQVRMRPEFLVIYLFGGLNTWPLCPMQYKGSLGFFRYFDRPKGIKSKSRQKLVGITMVIKRHIDMKAISQ